MQLKWDSLRHKTSPSHLLTLFNVKSAPVDVVTIAQSIGIKITYTYDAAHPLSGEVFLDGEGEDEFAHAIINASEAKVRQRFTVAHEIGHALLHDIKRRHFRDQSFVGTREEVEANRFAADLLVPFTMLAGLTKKHGYSVSSLANHFQVSFKMMDIRMEQLRAQTLWNL